MRWIVPAASALLIAGCGAPPSEITDGMPAPTGVAPGATLFFVDSQQRLQPQQRATGRLGTVTDALSLLLTGPGPDAALHTEIRASGETRVVVDTTADRIMVRLPLARRDVTSLGIDQIVCTALGVHVQGGGSPSATVQLSFTLPGDDPDPPRSCPLIPTG
jgi:hypothetical protein